MTEPRSDEAIRASITRMRTIMLGTGAFTFVQVNEQAEGLARSVIGPQLARVSELENSLTIYKAEARGALVLRDEANARAERARSMLNERMEAARREIADLEQANEQLRAKLSRVDALCERWRDKRTTASAGAALRLVLDDTDD